MAREYDQLKAACRRAWFDGQETAKAEGNTWAITGHRIKNVTYLAVRPVQAPRYPVLNFPADETEYQREMKRRYDESPPPSKPGRR